MASSESPERTHVERMERDLERFLSEWETFQARVEPLLVAAEQLLRSRWLRR